MIVYPDNSMTASKGVGFMYLDQISMVSATWYLRGDWTHHLHSALLYMFYERMFLLGDSRS
jgi:hypothetical protein